MYGLSYVGRQSNSVLPLRTARFHCRPSLIVMQLQRITTQLLSCCIAIAYASQDTQQVMNDPHLSVSPQTTSKPTLADLLTIDSSLSIFYSYAREIELSSIFSDQKAKNTVLVPTNKAVMALSRKPHQNPGGLEGEILISEEDFDKSSKRNVERWISAHIIPRSPISLESDTSYPTLLHQRTVTFPPAPNADPRSPDWGRVLLNGEARILGMKEALNGVMYVVDGTVIID